jgi:alpha-L-arabinofuranosidase
MKDDTLSCRLDGNEVYREEVLPASRHYAIAGRDENSSETIIKVVNADEVPFTATISLNHASVASEGKVITLAAKSLKDENTLDEPTKIAPITTLYNGFAPTFSYTFRPCSFTILRIPSK